MMWTKIKRYAAHYVVGLFASCWNAGVKAVKLGGGMSVAAIAAPDELTVPTIHALAGIFVAAVFWEAIDYFSDHPLPLALPADEPAPAPHSVSAQ